MELITERSRIATVAERWAAYGPEFRQLRTGSSKEIYDRLRALNTAKVSANTVNKIIGNATWTTIRCDECSANVLKAAVLYDLNGAAVFRICESCATKVKTLFKTGVAR